ncbi:XRE family transcriptional regulator [Halomonas sp. PAMB 3264]|uniref:helix-turn-helix domain-containing protein n=1 Tax=Halomonas sp. PAMB 3264 TaxID=3075222 RepID=UPI00289EBC1D|nr:XRE family transcriptional regulator [Halomonas sp. PAMB 3264]WNL41949.1 XRE family transcriptional regulator [Halomonas sp. PAMB 3264]
MAENRFSSIWDALEDTPEEALNMRLRSQLMMKVSERVRAWDVSQKEAAKRLGVTQPRLNDLLKGKINKFSLDALVTLTTSADMHVELVFSAEPTQNHAIA